MDIPVELSRIMITELGEQQVIFLKERDGDRSFPILIGIAEALAIDRRLKGVATPRPMTHELLANVIGALGGEIEKIVVNDLREHTFIATLYIRRNGQLIEVDSRPSDAIALGSALETPLYVAEHVFDAVTSQEPSTREERIQMLRDRREMLATEIEALSEILEDPEFLSEAPDGVVEEQQRRLEAMQNEHDSIDEVLRKLG
jgi:bifunctional DNase/RNase